MWLLWVLVTIVSLPLLILLFIYVYQDKILYSPNKPTRDLNKNELGERNPGERNINYEDIHIRTEDGVKLHGWLLKQNNSNRQPTIVYFHGIDGNMGMRLPLISKLYEMTNCNVVIVSYRGYGFSEGSPSEKGIRIDAVNILDYIVTRTDIDTQRIFIMGSSMGAAVAIYAASKVPEKIRGVILENPFLSMDEMIDMKTKTTLVRKIISNNHWKNIDIIQNVTIPIQFLTGLADPVVPPHHSKMLFDFARQARFKDKKDFAHGEHRGMFLKYPDTYFGILNEFMNRCLSY